MSSIELKSPDEIEKMSRASRVVAEVLDALRHQVRPGVTTAELDCFNHLVGLSNLKLTYHLPAMYGMESLHSQVVTMKAIIILGSSSSPTEGSDWQKLLIQWLKPNLEKRVPTLGVCFGHQSLVEAYGKAHGYHFTTEQGALEFGVFPVKFSAGHVALKHLFGKTCSVAMTHSGYTQVPGYQNISDIIPLAWPFADLERPPVAFSLERGRIITSQFHPDIQVSRNDHRAALRRYLAHNHRQIQNVFARSSFFGSLPSPHRADNIQGRQDRHVGVRNFKPVPRKDSTHGTKPIPLRVLPESLNSNSHIYTRNVAIDGERRTGEIEPWIENEVGPAFLLPSLNHLASSLLAQLKTSSPQQSQSIVHSAR